MPTSISEVCHLLRRVGFGCSIAEARALTALDRDDLVDHVLDVGSAPPAVWPPVDGGEWHWGDVVAIRDWWFERMRTSPAPLAEKLVLFWHGFFATQWQGYVHTELGLLDVYRQNGLGSYRDLLQRVALHPVMLSFLDARWSTQWDPNQNFARELLELYTIGRGAYTQADVEAVARAWTGWRVAEDGSHRVELDEPAFDDGPKLVLGQLRAWSGPEVVDLLCGRPDLRLLVARRLATKAWAFFGDPEAPAEAVDDVARTADRAGLEMRALLATLLRHPHFWSARTRLVRPPVDWVVAVLRATGVGAADAHPGDWQVDFATMGQELLFPPNVGGWPTNRAWLGPAAHLARQAFAHWISTLAVRRGFLVATRSLAVPDAVQACFDAFGLDRATPATRTAAESFLTQQRATGDPTVDDDGDVRGLVTITICSPEHLLA